MARKNVDARVTITATFSVRIRLENGPLAPPEADVTAVFVEVAMGNRAAEEKLVPLVYDQLTELAREYIRRERGDHPLQTTALVHEDYLQLVRQRSPNCQSRAQFFGVVPSS